MRLYKNPIIPGFHPDPSICRVGDNYFLVTSSFEYFPGVPLFHSKDLVNWEHIGYCLTRKSQLNLEKVPNSGGIFAPTIRYHDGIFYMITTNINHGGTFYVKTEDPFFEWSDPVFININGYDPSLFFDDDGKIYLTYAMGGIYQCEIDIETGELLTKPKLLWTGTGGKAPEGPHLYKINGKYYLMISEGGTEYGHMLTIARSDSPWGPFEECYRNPILTHRSIDHPIQCVGHGDLIEAHDGSWWIVCLGVRPISYPPKYNLGRETFLVPVKWDNDGWPIVGNNGRVELEMEGPSFYKGEFKKEKGFFDDFDKEKFKWNWNFRRNPDEKLYSLTEKRSFLILKCGENNLDDVGSLAFIGIRQEDFNCEVRTKIEFDPRNEKEEAGLTVFLSERFHYDIGVQKINDKKLIFLRKTIASLKTEEYFEIPEEKEIILGVKANQLYYYFYYEIKGERKELGKGETYLLTIEVGGKFTGNYFGLYATGNGNPTLTSAYFDWFEYIRYKEYIFSSKIDELLKDKEVHKILLKYIPIEIIEQIKGNSFINNFEMLITVIQYRYPNINIENIISELTGIKIN